MAKAPGTYNSNGVNCTMDPPFKKSKSQPENKMAGPFDQGSFGIPTQVYDRNLGDTSVARPTQTAPSQQGQKREGTKEYPYGGGTMRDGKSKY